MCNIKALNMSDDVKKEIGNQYTLAGWESFKQLMSTQRSSEVRDLDRGSFLWQFLTENGIDNDSKTKTLEYKPFFINY